nr:AlpA family phage regulatory protein [Pseudacidovorax sp. RU35E]
MTKFRQRPVTTEIGYPAALRRPQAAAYCGLSESTFGRAVRRGEAPQPRRLADKRTGWLRAELDAWLVALPISDLPPPMNTGAKKPRAVKRAADAQAGSSQQSAPADPRAA